MVGVLPEGVYEQVITEGLERSLDHTRAAGLRVGQESLAHAEADALLARHAADEVLRALGAVRGEHALEQRIALCNAVLASVRGQSAEALDLRVRPEGRVLREVRRGEGALPRACSPLAVSTLLTGADAEPRLGHELEREIASADAVDALVSFVTWEGWRRLQPAFEALALRGRRLRLITTTYIGATDAEAIDAIARLPNAEVRVSYDARRTRLHAKAWLFHRESGFGAAYVGSANLSRAALGGGLEWTMKVCQADLPHVVEKFAGTFESLWNDSEFEAYAPDDPDCVGRLRSELARARGGAGPTALGAVPFFATLRPYPFQEEILECLATEREVHGRTRNLVVAATGTGKTMVAAFDYQRIAARAGVRPRLLFVAHREEILAQSLAAFRHVLRDEAFGELLGGGYEPRGYDHLFTTVQSFRSRGLARQLPPDHWHYVVVDECHHSTAVTWTDVMERLRPAILLGLTATPERADGESILGFFGDRCAAEMRLWHALDRQLLAPFEYYGVADGIDLSRIDWSRGAYDTRGLDNLYTGNDRRAELAFAQFTRLRGNIRASRALGFCVSVAHAEFMARKFNELGKAAGLRAIAVHGGTDDSIRRAVPRRLETREVHVVFTCDLYNEGVDLPCVDTLLLLRPTASVTVFLQQLGRGLRLYEGKTACLVLDFIGQCRREFRFDRLLTALTGVPRGRLREAVEAEFPTLPSGCHLALDRVARDIVVENLRQALAGGPKRITQEICDASARRGGPLSLAEYLEDTGRALEEVYATGSGWTTLLRSAGVLRGPTPEGERDLSDRLGLILHLDDPDRLALYRDVARGTLTNAPLDLRSERRLLMLGYQLWHERGTLLTPSEVVRRITSQPTVCDEITQLLELMRERVRLAARCATPADWALSLHRSYARREVLAAVGNWTERARPESREGVRRVGTHDELFFVTLEKEEKHFSPTTRYRDYAISASRFHWQSQSTASEDSETGLRYRQQHARGLRFWLFVRKTRNDPYRFLGPVHYVGHHGSRPMNVTWRLDAPLPAAWLREFASLGAA